MATFDFRHCKTKEDVDAVFRREELKLQVMKDVKEIFDDLKRSD